jgi:hypothetical protein
MPGTTTRTVGFLCLLGVLGACCTPDRPCVSGQMRPRPVYVAPEAFCALERQIDCFNHRFAPYEAVMDKGIFPKRICKRLIQINEDLQHINAAMISREIAPEKIARQLDRMEADLGWIETQISVPVFPNACCKSPAEMAASLDVQRAAQRGKRAEPLKPQSSPKPQITSPEPKNL